MAWMTGWIPLYVGGCVELEAGAHGCNGLFGDVGIGVRQKNCIFVMRLIIV